MVVAMDTAEVVVGAVVQQPPPDGAHLSGFNRRVSRHRHGSLAGLRLGGKERVCEGADMVGAALTRIVSSPTLWAGTPREPS